MKTRISDKHEQDVINVITSLGKGYHIINNAIFKSHGYVNEIDSLIICKYGIFIIEAKSWKGEVSGSKEDFMWTYTSKSGTCQKYNPIRQNQKHVTMVNKKFGIARENIKPVVVFTDFTDLSKVEEENVISLSQLKNYILNNSTKFIFSKREIKNIKYSMLKAKGNSSGKRKKTMIRKCLKKQGYTARDISKIVGDKKYYYRGKFYE